MPLRRATGQFKVARQLNNASVPAVYWASPVLVKLTRMDDPAGTVAPPGMLQVDAATAMVQLIVAVTDADPGANASRCAVASSPGPQIPPHPSGCVRATVKSCMKIVR